MGDRAAHPGIPPNAVREVLPTWPWPPCPEATAAAIRDGWLRTGDLARADGDGYLYLVDRG